MILPSYTKRKFLSFPLKKQHKKAAELLKILYENKLFTLSSSYRDIELWMDLPPLNFTPEKIADRFHFHLTHTSVSLKENTFLQPVKRLDSLTDTPYLPLAFYLDNLRSGHNIGSILRTVEAFRLGSVYFSPNTPFIDNKKVQKASMGTYFQVPCHQVSFLSSLPAPFIALETVENAPPFSSFSFPSSCTILIGNEEYGLSSSLLQKADKIIQIPLVGSKNSLNVACAFAIIAAEINRQHRSHIFPS